MTGPWVQAAIVLLAAMTAPVAARAGCVWSDLVTDDVTTAIVQSAAARTFFVKDEVLGRGCPNESANCTSPAYLTRGDLVLSGPVQGRYTCAGFVGAQGVTTIGWLPSAALAPQDAAQRRPSDWAGHWVAPEQDLVLTAAGGESLSVKGEATWGMGDAARRRRGSVHTGEVTGTARPVDGVLAFTMGDDGKALPYEAADEFTCRVRMVRRGPYLVVRDNSACGGANVSFSGFYRRKQ